MHKLFHCFDFLMTKSGIHIIKLFFTGFVVIMYVMCHKPENIPVNKPVNNNPCNSRMQLLLCLPALSIKRGICDPHKSDN